MSLMPILKVAMRGTPAGKRDEHGEIRGVGNENFWVDVGQITKLADNRQHWHSPVPAREQEH